MEHQFDSRLVARYIIYRAKEEGKYMNLTKTHKLLYILDGMCLFLYGQDIINESPRSWQYGPAYPHVQSMMKTSPPKNLGYFEKGFEHIEKETGLKFLITRILERFGNCTSKELSDWSHKKDSPWSQTRQKHDNDSNAVISRKTLGDYFSETFRKTTTII